jgi:hypothetical protein
MALLDRPNRTPLSKKKLGRGVHWRDFSNRSRQSRQKPLNRVGVSVRYSGRCVGLEWTHAAQKKMDSRSFRKKVGPRLSPRSKLGKPRRWKQPSGSAPGLPAQTEVGSRTAWFFVRIVLVAKVVIDFDGFDDARDHFAAKRSNAHRHHRMTLAEILSQHVC